MPEGYAEAWRRLDEDYDRRSREATALQIEGTLRAHDWDGGYRISPGCIVYRAGNGEKLEYDMTKTPQGWRIIGIGTSRPLG